LGGGNEFRKGGRRWEEGRGPRLRSEIKEEKNTRRKEDPKKEKEKHRGPAAKEETDESTTRKWEDKARKSNA